MTFKGNRLKILEISVVLGKQQPVSSGKRACWEQWGDLVMGREVYQAQGGIPQHWDRYPDPGARSGVSFLKANPHFLCMHMVMLSKPTGLVPGRRVRT